MSTEVKIFSQEEILNKIKKDRKTGFSCLYDVYSSALFGFISNLCPDTKTSENILIESFLRIWQQLPAFDSTQHRLHGWMLGIVRGVSEELIVSEKNSKKNEILKPVNNVSTKDALSLIYFKGLSLKQTAQLLNISITELNSLLHSQIQVIRTTVKDQ